jgi:hypothetical protein
MHVEKTLYRTRLACRPGSARYSQQERVVIGRWKSRCWIVHGIRRGGSDGDGEKMTIVDGKTSVSVRGRGCFV